MVGKNVYPLKFAPVLEKTVWGGSTLKNFRKIEDGEDYGIAWEVTAHPNATNVILNGIYKGQTLKELVSNNPSEILGDKVSSKDVLRVSYINAKDNLSVQVHPHIKELEQNEIWYILDAPENAKVILGVDVQDKNELKLKIEQDETESILKLIPVEIGDFIYIPGGLVHALTSGVTVLEVGQNHDNTYRLFDYNRGREIHIDKSLEHTRYNVSEIKSNVEALITEETRKSIAYQGHDFTIEMIEGNTPYSFESDNDRYYVYTNLGEDCMFEYLDDKFVFEKGESLLIPAYLGTYTISGNLKLFKSYIS